MSAEVAAPPYAPISARLAEFGGLRMIAIVAGIGWALAFIVVGVCYRLQMYGDGSVFSYAVTVGESWAVHWHNIAGRTFVYLFCMAPAEAYVRLTQDATGGVALYGLLFFGAQLVGLVACFAIDRSGRRTIFTSACASTACLCPLVFGFPTEMWMAHAVFWPTLALSHYGLAGLAGFSALLLAMLALVFTHEGAIVLGIGIVATALLRGADAPAFRRSIGALIVALAIWACIKLIVSPDDYFAPVLARAELNFFNPRAFTEGLFAELVFALVGFCLLSVALRRFGTTRAHVCSGLIVSAGLIAYWLQFHPALHAENRYFLRTALVIATPCFGFLAAAWAFAAEGYPNQLAPWPSRRAGFLATRNLVSGSAAAIMIVTLVNAVETARFVVAWTEYTASLRYFATGTAADPMLGDPRFVSSDRIAAVLKPVSWSSTTPFLSILLAPGFKPTRLVVDPAANYFWLPCPLAHQNEITERAIPVASRHLIRAHTCLHR